MPLAKTQPRSWPTQLRTSSRRDRRVCAVKDTGAWRPTTIFWFSGDQFVAGIFNFDGPGCLQDLMFLRRCAVWHGQCNGDSYNRSRQDASTGKHRERKPSQALPIRTHLRQREVPLARAPISSLASPSKRLRDSKFYPPSSSLFSSLQERYSTPISFRLPPQTHHPSHITHVREYHRILHFRQWQYFRRYLLALICPPRTF